MSLPREWSFQESCRMVDRGLGPGPTATASQEAVGPIIDENMNQQNQLGSLFSIHSAPVFDINNGLPSPKRPASLVVQATATSTPLVPPHVSPPDTIDDEDNDNLLTISSLTARPLIAKSRELRSSRYRPRSKKPKKVSRPKNPNLIPLDGGYGWVIVFGAFFVQFWVAGLVKSYGVLYVEVMETFKDSSASLASWIPAILSCLCLALAPVTSMLCQKYSCRGVVFVGGLFCALGLTISYFATSLVHLFFTFGVLTGIGGGLSTTPGIVIVSQYFDKHRALANGICVSGTAAGSFVFPLLIERLVASFGFHGTILLLGGCMLHVCVSATLYRPLEDNCVEETEKESIEKLEVLKESLPTKQQKLDLLFANDATTRHNLLNELFHQNAVVAVELTDSEEEKDIMGEALRMKPISKIRSSSILHSVEDLSTDSTCVYKARSSLRSLRSSVPAVTQKPIPNNQPTLPEEPAKSFAQKITRYIDLSLLKDPQFIMMCLSVSLMSTGSPYMLYYLPAYVHAAGYTKSEAGYLVAISAVLDLCGRLGLGWLSDLQLFDRRKGYIGSIVGAGVAVLAIPMAHSFYVLACSVGMYGLCLGCWFLLVPVLLADQYGTDKISSSYGLVRMFQSVGAISIPPLAGYLRDVTGSYAVCFLCMGTCMVLGGLPMLLVSGEHSKPSTPAERAIMTRRVSSTVSLKETKKSSPWSCESRRHKGRPQTTRGIRKRCRIRAGWHHEWIPRTELPSRTVLAIHQVVKGPFSSPRLVSASPYVLVSSYGKNGYPEICKLASRCPQIKRGIPDPWAEYLAYRGFCSKKDQRIVHRDLDLGCKNIYVTATVWKDLGLPLGQGIPDPWKIPVSRKDVELHGEKRHRHEKNQCCRYCKHCQDETRVPYRCVEKAAVNVDPSLSSPTEQHEVRSGEICRKETLQHRTNFEPEVSSCFSEHPLVKKPHDCTAPCNPHRYKHRSIDVDTEPVLLATRPSVGTSLTARKRPEYSAIPRADEATLRLAMNKWQQQISDIPSLAKIHQPQDFGVNLSQGIKIAQDLIDAAVQTRETLPVARSVSSVVQDKFLSPNYARQTTPVESTYGFCKRQVHSGGTLCHACGRRYQEQDLVRDAACACESRDFRKKRVGFETRNSFCTETIRVPGKPNVNLNVARLSCGCVHISPCTGTQEYFGAVTGRHGVTKPGDAVHGKTPRPRGYGYQMPKSYDPKPKMIARMKRLLNRCKPTSRQQHKVEKVQTVTSEIRVNQIPDDAKLVCCQCSCPYLKIRNSSERAPSQPVARKKEKCACAHCLARRDRREKHRRRNVVTEEQTLLVRPRSSGRRVQVEPDAQMMIKCHSQNPGNSCRSCRMQHDSSDNKTFRDDARSLQVSKGEPISIKEKSYTPSAPQRNSTIINEMKECCEITKKLSADVNSFESWQYPAVFGAPWYSSDSGENADISETSRHTVRCTSITEVPPETALVTSCTFISRINHSTVLQRLNKQQRRPTREEKLIPALRDAQDLDSEFFVSKKCLRQPEPLQTSTSTGEDFQPKTNENQVPLLDIKESRTNHSRESLRMAYIDPPVGLVSFCEDEKPSWSSCPTNGDKKRRNSLGNRAKLRKKEIRKNPTSSQVTVDVDSMTDYNRLGHSFSQRRHLALPKTQMVPDETENSTDVANDKLKISNPTRDIGELENSGNPKNICDSSEGTRSLSANAGNFACEPMVTTIFSPRKIFTNSSTICNPESCTRKCRRAQAPKNTSTEGGSSEDQGLPTNKGNAIIYRCELPLTPGPCFSKASDLSNKTRKISDSRPRYTICSPAKVNGFLEGEGMSSFELNNNQQTENGSPREFVEQVRTLFPNRIIQDGMKSSTDNKCYLKYCSLRRSGPCLVSPSRKISRIQHLVCLDNDNCEDDVLERTEKDFQFDRRAFSSSSSKRNLVPLRGDAFSSMLPHPKLKMEDKFNIG